MSMGGALFPWLVGASGSVPALGTGICVFALSADALVALLFFLPKMRGRAPGWAA
jgi:hypothetical protein